MESSSGELFSLNRQEYVSDNICMGGNPLSPVFRRKIKENEPRKILNSATNKGSEHHINANMSFIGLITGATHSNSEIVTNLSFVTFSLARNGKLAY